MNKDAQQSGLKPSLGLFDATAISVGVITDTGIFGATGVAASLVDLLKTRIQYPQTREYWENKENHIKSF